MHPVPPGASRRRWPETGSSCRHHPLITIDRQRVRSPGVLMSGILLSMAVLQVLTILVSLVRAKGLALLLGPAGFGVASTIDQVVLTLVSLGGLAMPFTALKVLARDHSEHAGNFVRDGAAFLRLVLGLGVATLLIASLMVVRVPSLFGSELPRYQAVLQVAVLGVPPALMLILFVNLLATVQRPAAAATVNLVGVALLAVAAVGGAWWRGLMGMYLAGVIVGATGMLAGLVYFATRLRVGLFDRGASVRGLLRGRKELVGYAGAFYVIMGANAIMLLVVRNLVLARLGEAPAGHLQALFNISLTVGAVLLPLSNLYLAPIVNRNLSPGAKADAANSFVARMLVLLLIGALPVIVAPDLLLRVLFSAAFAPAADVLWVFVAWQCVFQVMYAYQQLLVGLDDVRFAAGASVAGSAIAALGSGFLVGPLGLGGVALALVSGHGVVGLCLLLRLQRRHRIRITSSVATRFSAVLTLVCLVGWGITFSGRHPALSVGSRLLGVGGSLLALWLLLDRDERDPRTWAKPRV